MKKILLNVYRGIVGYEFGYLGAGNKLWYHFLSSVINCMLVWWLKPEIAHLFTFLFVSIFICVLIGRHFNLPEEKSIFVIYYITSALIFLKPNNWKFSVITYVIFAVAFLIAPDCTGNNIFMIALKKDGVQNKTPLLFHTIIFGAFLVVTLLMSTHYLVKIVIIVGVLISHIIIDLYE